MDRDPWIRNPELLIRILEGNKLRIWPDPDLDPTVPKHFCGHWLNICYQTGSKSLNIIKFCKFLWNIFKCFINVEDLDPGSVLSKLWIQIQEASQIRTHRIRSTTLLISPIPGTVVVRIINVLFCKKIFFNKLLPFFYGPGVFCGPASFLRISSSPCGAGCRRSRWRSWTSCRGCRRTCWQKRLKFLILPSGKFLWRKWYKKNGWSSVFF